MKNEHAHTLTEAHSLSVNVANHPHILVLPGRELPEDKQQLLSHHLTLFFYIHYPLLLFLLITLTSPSPPFPMLPLPLSAIVTTPPLPQFSISTTLSTSSQCCIDFSQGLRCHISISLNSHTHSIFSLSSLPPCYIAGLLSRARSSSLISLFLLYNQSPPKLNLHFFIYPHSLFKNHLTLLSHLASPHLCFC